ncbi:G patch domain-containing protein 4 [Orussus abietinus]|uniref:G patch domain-containing protein 4 n=1 Tax=Orussus abietinus TaxID=222816 RepID=UPI00062509FA|nr:G patch domain-containing protein 4 [Orussus abietinus]XP_012277945.1 G patch domain-containing protein 4 [Orussus abietinus]
MSMLAEPKRKQRWTLNPRGKAWSDDSNKFGQKMLEKMGWSSGKGLGAKEQGVTEHVRVNFKNDQLGVGFKSKDTTEWTQQQVEFDDLLKQLQNNDAETTKSAESEKVANDASLEVKSQLSRVRVHYRKFTAGKDVNKYSSKDLASILGKKDSVEQPESQEHLDDIGTEDCTAGVVTVKGGSMEDYFKKKLPNFYQQKGNGKDEKKSDGEKQGTAKKVKDTGSMSKVVEFSTQESNCAFDNPCLDLNSPQRNTSKKQKNPFVFENEGFNMKCNEPETPVKIKSELSDKGNEGFINPALNLESPADDCHNGTEFEVSRAEFGICNSGLDLTDELTGKKHVTFNDEVEYSDGTTRERKGKKLKLDKFEVLNEKMKKKKKKEKKTVEPEIKGFSNEALDVEIISQEVADNEQNERKSIKARRRKTRRLSSLETIIEAPEEDTKESNSVVPNEELSVEPDSSNNTESEVKRKFKKKKRTNLKQETPIIDINSSDDEAVEIIKEVSKKAKKKENPPDDSNSKRKKRKRKDEVDNVYDEECQVVATDKENAEHDSSQNEVSTPKKKKKKEEKKPKELVEVDTTPYTPQEAQQNSTKQEDTVQKKKKKKKITTSETWDTPSNETNENVSAESTGDTIVQTPTESRLKISKKILKVLFIQSPVLHFNGSNINEIKGYGSQMEKAN